MREQIKLIFLGLLVTWLIVNILFFIYNIIKETKYKREMDKGNLSNFDKYEKLIDSNTIISIQCLVIAILAQLCKLI